ncbi:DUF4276 family protein [Orrella sp. JC864]|uniref:DUF4276 family protein n=1 Tax=Orrella sp. JC864 TaxID=3120298 RepID=UPI0030099773
MSRVYLLVEGQTEEAFVNELLVSPYAARGLYLTPIIVRTSPGHRGGVVSYAKIRPQIERLCKQDPAACVTTLFDLYALPEDFPGKRDVRYPVQGAGWQKAVFLERALAKDVAQQNFIPHLFVHEFEALLLVDIAAFKPWTDDDDVLEPLMALRRKAEPEEINDGPGTAPSKRILAVWPQYQKTFHGPIIAGEIGLDRIRGACPHFSGWLDKLEALP